MKGCNKYFLYLNTPSVWSSPCNTNVVQRSSWDSLSTILSFPTCSTSAFSSILQKVHCTINTYHTYTIYITKFKLNNYKRPLIQTNLINTIHRHKICFVNRGQKWMVIYLKPYQALLASVHKADVMIVYCIDVICLCGNFISYSTIFRGFFEPRSW